MNRKQVYAEMKEIFGLVPSFFKQIPDAALEHEWKLFKAMEFEEISIPKKYKELMGVALSGATRCKYCALFHTEMAKLNGATDAEIEESAHYAKHTAGWSAYVNGLQIDYEQFKDEIKQACEHAKRSQRKAA